MTNVHFRNSINAQTFPIKKANGVTRIFVIGGSAAFAWPFTEEFGFSGYLRRVLNKFAPGKFEVINAAGMSFGSHRVYDVLQDVIKLSPDLVIVYSGNNEYVERNVIAKRKKRNGALEWIGSRLSQTNVYRAVRLGIFRAAPSIFRQQTGTDLTDLRADSVVSRGALGRSSQIDQEVLSNFRLNIKEIRDRLAESSTKAIFFTTPSNVVGYRPTSPPLRFADKTSAERWNKMQQEVIDSINSQTSVVDQGAKTQSLHHAAELLLEMTHIAPEEPWSFFTLGQVYMWLGEYDLAYPAFVHAKDLDARPIRALSSFNEAVREIVREKKDDTGLKLFDLEEALSAEVLRGNADWLFLDYCHFTDAGHKLVAINLLPVMQEILGTNFDLGQLSASIFGDDWGKNKDRMIQNNVLYASGLTYIHNGQFEAAEKDFKKILSTFEPEAGGVYPSLVYRALSHVYQGQDKKELYKEYLGKAIKANPDNFEALISGGLLFLEEGDLLQAEEMLTKAIRLNRYAPLAFEGLGRIELSKGRAKEAIAQFEEALRIGGDSFLLRKDLGKAHLQLGNVDKAISAWQEAMSFDSSDSEVLELLKKYSR
ncbi:MAG: tetratricopeptide repeat protein [Desulfobulbaceae bacterium]|nr:tetratricopeptide repeat protein [Desulfobulbaceae bacterium]